MGTLPKRVKSGSGHHGHDAGLFVLGEDYLHSLGIAHASPIVNFRLILLCLFFDSPLYMFQGVVPPHN